MANLGIKFECDFKDFESSLKGLGDSMAQAAKGPLTKYALTLKDAITLGASMGTKVPPKTPLKDWTPIKAIGSYQGMFELGYTASAEELIKSWMALNPEWELISNYGKFFLKNKESGNLVGAKGKAKSEQAAPAVEDYSPAAFIAEYKALVKLGKLASAKHLSSIWLTENPDWTLMHVKHATLPYESQYLQNEKLGLMVGHTQADIKDKFQNVENFEGGVDNPPSLTQVLKGSGKLYMGGKEIGNVSNVKIEPVESAFEASDTSWASSGNKPEWMAFDFGDGNSKVVGLTIPNTSGITGKLVASVGIGPTVQLAAKVQAPPPGWKGAGKIAQKVYGKSYIKEAFEKAGGAGKLTPEQVAPFVDQILKEPPLASQLLNWPPGLLKAKSKSKLGATSQSPAASTKQKLEQNLSIWKDIKTQTMVFEFKDVDSTAQTMLYKHVKASQDLIETLGLKWDANWLMDYIAGTMILQKLDPSKSGDVQLIVQKLLKQGVP